MLNNKVMMQNKIQNDCQVGRLLNLMEAAKMNEQPITISMPLEVFKSALDYSVKMRLDGILKAQELERKQEEQGDNVSPRDARKILGGISAATLWRYAKEGLITRKYVGGKVYYSRKELTEFMEG